MQIDSQIYLSGTFSVTFFVIISFHLIRNGVDTLQRRKSS